MKIFYKTTFLRTVLFVFILLVIGFTNAYGNINEKDIIPLESSLMGRNYDEVKKEGLLFKGVLPEKNGQLLAYIKLPDGKLWNFALVGARNKIISTIMYIVHRDDAKAKKECPNVIKLLIKMYGKDYRVWHAELSTTMPNAKGYCMTWEKGKKLIALKFGPLNKSAKKFYLQLSISSDVKWGYKILRIDRKSSSTENNKKILKELTDYLGENL